MRLTKEEIKNEIAKCGASPEYFLKSYVKITHPLKGAIPFTTYDFQDDLLKDFKDYRFNVVLKARQLGISTIVAGYAAWLMLFRREKQVLVVATKFKTAGNLVVKVKKMIKSLPDWMRIAEISVDNQQSFELTNGSKIQASTTNATDAGRSEALSLLIVDEAAFVEGMEELWTGILPTISTGGRCIALSTPNGVGNWFYKTYSGAEAGTNNFHPINLPWNRHPDRDDKWFQDQTKNMSRKEIAQEFECVIGDTRIITKIDGFKNIKDIEIGDEVLTHNGRYRKVIRKFNKKVNSEELTSISTPMSRKNPIIITKEHPLLVATRSKRNSVNIFNEFKEKCFEEKWINSNDIQEMYGDYVVPQYLNALVPKLKDDVFLGINKSFDLDTLGITYKKENNKISYFRQKGSTKKNILLDYQTGKIVGLFLSEGFSDEKQTVFSFNSLETELIEFIEEWANKYDMRVRKDIRNYSNCTTVHISNKFLVLFLKHFVDGTKCYDKILNEEIYKTSKDFIKGIIDGIWLGDGLHTPDNKNILGLVNEKLIYQIRTLMTSFDLITRVSYVEQNRNNKRRYYLELNNVNGKTIDICTSNGIEYRIGQRTKFENNKWWGRVEFNTPSFEEKEIEVFNIEVEEDNSYICENLTVHNCSFNMSGETVIDPGDMKRLKEDLKEPKYKTGFDRNYWIWEEPKNGNSYVVIADVARGDGNDYSTFHIINTENMEQVGEYQGKPAADMFAMLLNSVGREYGNALLVIENASYGFNVIDKMITLEYPNLYWSNKASHEFVDSISAESSDGVVAGFSTTTKTRPLIIAKMEEVIRNRIIKLNSPRLYRELETFVWNNGKPEALRGYNDDLVMALAIGCWVRDTALTSNKRETAYTKALLNAMVKSNTNIDTKISGMHGYREKASSDPFKQDIMRSRMYSPWGYKG